MKVGKKILFAFLLPSFVHASPITTVITQRRQNYQVPPFLNNENPKFSIAQIGKDIDRADYYGRSGASISLSTNGKLLAIGAYAAYGYGGHVLTYAFDDITETWVQHDQEIISEKGGVHSGASLSMSHDGMTIAIGAPKKSLQCRQNIDRRIDSLKAIHFEDDKDYGVE